MAHHFQINRNGNTAESLITELRDVMLAAQALSDRLSAVTIHGRNYQTLEDGPGEVPGYQSAKGFHADWAQAQRMAGMAKEVADWAQDGAMRAMSQKESGL